MKRQNIKISRVYELPEKKDGIWILVDRLWPRGIKKEDLSADLWLKEIAPSPDLRKWFDHDPDKWSAFKKKYVQELEGKEDLVEQVLKKVEDEPVTLLYAAKDKKHNHALVLKRVLESWPDLSDFSM